jgi:hypothetical protein
MKKFLLSLYFYLLLWGCCHHQSVASKERIFSPKHVAQSFAFFEHPFPTLFYFDYFMLSLLLVLSIDTATHDWVVVSLILTPFTWNFSSAL